MPKRSIIWGLLASLAASQGATYAQTRPYAAPGTQARRGYQDFAPGPALARENSADPAREKVKNAAQDAYRGQDYKRAIALVDPICKAHPTDAVALYIRGSAKIDLGLRDSKVELVREGIADARNAVTHGATDEAGAVYYIPYLHGMMTLAKLEGRKDHAQIVVDVADQVLALPELKTSEKANLQFQRAGAYLFMEKYEDAAKAYQAAIEIDNSHVGAYVALADCHAKAGDHDAARKAYDTACTAFSNSPLIHNNRGSYLRTRGDLAGAAADFERSTKLDRQFVVGWINHGFTLMQMGDLAGAEKSFDKALSLDPEKANVYGLRGQVRVAQGKLAAGIADHERTVAKEPNFADGHTNLGFARFYNGEYEGALTAFDKATQLDPSRKYLDTWRMLCLVTLGRANDRGERFEDTFTKDAERRDWVDQMLVYLAGDQTAEELLATIDTTVPDDADEAARKAVETRAAQQNCEAYFVIARKLLAEGEKDRATEHFEKVLATDAKALAAYRGAQFQLGKFAVANKPGIDRN